MRKLFLTVGVSILSIWINGCDSLPFFNKTDSSTTNTPETSPSPTSEVPESPSPTPTDGVSPSPDVPQKTDGLFPSPDVPEKSEISTDLIRSTDPNERTSSLKQEVQTDTTSQTQTSTPGIIDTKDPFSGLPTIPVPSRETDGTGDSIFTQLPELGSQRVPDIPSLPEPKLPSSWTQPRRTQPTNQFPDLSQAAPQQNSQRLPPRRRPNQENQNLRSRPPAFQSNITQLRPQPRVSTPSQSRPQPQASTPSQSRPQPQASTPSQSRPQPRASTPSQSRPQ
ncbi:hypothetical protein, partial [Okeania sp.]|uniref:hypothetical protein n=1 Tax=Okeania sp. TaxID=3100323 RepID=UPI002B4ACAD8